MASSATPKLQHLIRNPSVALRVNERFTFGRLEVATSEKLAAYSKELVNSKAFQMIVSRLEPGTTIVTSGPTSYTLSSSTSIYTLSNWRPATEQELADYTERRDRIAARIEKQKAREKAQEERRATIQRNKNLRLLKLLVLRYPKETRDLLATGRVTLDPATPDSSIVV